MGQEEQELKTTAMLLASQLHPHHRLAQVRRDRRVAGGVKRQLYIQKRLANNKEIFDTVKSMCMHACIIHQIKVRARQLKKLSDHALSLLIP